MKARGMFLGSAVAAAALLVPAGGALAVSDDPADQAEPSQDMQELRKAEERADRREREALERARKDEGRDREDEPEFGRDSLAYGHCNKRVKALRKELKHLSYLLHDGGKCLNDQARWALVAFQKQEGLKRNGKAKKKTLKRLAKAEEPKAPGGGDKRRMVVDLSKQVLYLVKSDRVKRTIAISSGKRGWATPKGSFSVYRKERMSYSNQFNAWLPWASYFVRGIAFHAWPDVPPKPASHGCVRVPRDFAKEVYRFASIGTQVRVVH